MGFPWEKPLLIGYEPKYLVSRKIHHWRLQILGEIPNYEQRHTKTVGLGVFPGNPFPDGKLLALWLFLLEPFLLGSTELQGLKASGFKSFWPN